MTTPTNEEVRRQFEAWADAYGMYMDRDASDGSYVSDNTHDAWLGYQAALSSPLVVEMMAAGDFLAMNGTDGMVRRWKAARAAAQLAKGAEK